MTDTGANSTEATENAILEELVGQTLVVTINRPEAGNAINGPVGHGLSAAFERATSSPNVRTVILTGAGERIFCAGMDLKAFASGGGLSGFGKGMAAFRSCPKPVIAAINGACVAGGFELMMDCDLVVAVEGARFGIPEVKRGLFAAAGGVRLARRLPLARALELGLTGEPISASEAQKWGLINRVVPRAELMSSAMQLADLIAANGPLAVIATKELMRRELGPDGDTDDRFTELRDQVFRSADAIEGASAFAEKRPPKWQGR